MHWRPLATFGILTLVATVGVPYVTCDADEPAANVSAVEANTPNELSYRQSIAVALNYCRASFHRIKTAPTVSVLKQEEEKILNNLNLNGIADEDVIKLYSSVLDEIGQIHLADREREIFQDKYKYAIRQRMAVNAFAFGTQLATAQVGSAIRTGADSWWDYRSNEMNRDVEIWKVEKTRMNEVVSKSSRFLDTFWKLAQKNDIPDRWLVRGDDLDKLELAIREPKPEVRLRVLQRMEPFMEYYPPYWYYVGRTQQSLGQLFAAAKTYEHLALLGTKHFRKDDMLAAALSNRAIIQEYLGQPGSSVTARRALTYSTEVPEANLICAGVLERNGYKAEAEDAILRNIDVDLERSQSMVTLLSLYYRHDYTDKLIARLSDAETVREVPIPVLVQCAAKIGNERMPQAVSTHLASSLNLYPRFSFGKDDLVLVAMPTWHLHDAQVTLSWKGQKWQQPQFETRGQVHQARFAGILDLGHPFSPGSELSQVEVSLKYPDTPEITIQLQQGVKIAAEPAKTVVANDRSSSSNEANTATVASSRKTTPGFRLTSLAVGETKVELIPHATASEVESSDAANEHPDAESPATNVVPPEPAAKSASAVTPSDSALIQLKGIVVD
ncbi:MAG: hypothetical protein O2955_08245 [Planctomycetota bacterium]|nr:hypothetical protein [Planctomycetota bacterium]MDA1212493.1 hypothetical protein [Planctomycetota bacterium]